METKKILVTGAAGQIAYALSSSIAKGEVYGKDTPVELVLLDIEAMNMSMQGVAMELDDCAHNLLTKVTCTTDIQDAFTGVHCAFLVGAMPRKEGMERSDLLKANAKIFKIQGEAIEKYSPKDIKVLVIGNPANTNAYICSHYAPKVPKKNFSAMTRLDQNRAMAQLAKKLGIFSKDVYNVIIWGNHSATQVPDATHAIAICDGKEVKCGEAIDPEWGRTVFVPTVQQRGAAIIKARKLSSAMSAAHAGIDHMRDWVQGSPVGKWVNMAVVSNGEYGVEAGLFYSYPVYCQGGEWKIVEGLSVNEHVQKKMKVTEEELKNERDTAMNFLASE